MLRLGAVVENCSLSELQLKGLVDRQDEQPNVGLQRFIEKYCDNCENAECP